MLRSTGRIAALAAGLILVAPAAASAGAYHDNRELAARLRDAASTDRKFFRMEELVRDRRDRPVWMVRAGSAEGTAPAVLVVAGLDGRHLVGTEMALALLERLAADSAARRRVGDRALWIVPRLNLDGAEAALSGAPARARSTTDGPAEGMEARWRDTDRDGADLEDRADDLDGDGRITWVRVRTPEGTLIRDGDSFVRPARPEAGERGEWRRFPEGRDNDGDDVIDEEADAGIDLARNFTHDFPWFEPGAALHQASEPASRAVLDLLGSHPNVAAVVVFGFEDNLLTAPSPDKTSDPDLGASRWERSPVTLPNVHDLPLISHLGKQYRESLGLADGDQDLSSGSYGLAGLGFPDGAVADPARAARGGLAATAYYAWGRLAVATPVWTPGLAVALSTRAAGAESDTSGGSDDREPPEPEVKEARDSRVEQEEAFRNWLTERDPTAWTDWSAFEHPDFPGRPAEIGGYAPLVHINPPASEIDALAGPHVDLVLGLVDDLPRLAVRSASLTPLGGETYRLEMTVENTGYLPDVLAQGVYSVRVRPTRVALDLPPGGEVVGDVPGLQLDRIPGSGGSVELLRVLRLPGSKPRIGVRVISEYAGSIGFDLQAGQVREGIR